MKSIHSSSSSSLPILHRAKSASRVHKHSSRAQSPLNHVKFSEGDNPRDPTNIMAKRLVKFQNSSTDLTIYFIRHESLLYGIHQDVSANAGIRKVLPYNTSLKTLQKVVASFILQNPTALAMTGKFAVDLKFLKEDAWILMDSEIQWLHAKSLALDRDGNQMRILYGALNDSDIISRGSIDAGDSTFLDMKSRVTDQLNNPSYNGLLEEQSLISEGGFSKKSLTMQHEMPSLVEESLVSGFSLSRPSVKSRGSDKSKQHMLASNLEKRLLRSSKS